MKKSQKIVFIFVASGLLLSLLLHLGIMFDRIPFEQKYILYTNLFLIVVLVSVRPFTSKTSSEALNENPFKMALKVFPLWLTIGLGAILFYSVLVFINFTYINNPLADKPDMVAVLTKFNKGASAATMFFYAATFGLLNLRWKVKKVTKKEVDED